MSLDCSSDIILLFVLIKYAKIYAFLKNGPQVSKRWAVDASKGGGV